MRVGKGTNFIEENLTPKDKKIFLDYMAFLSTTASKRKMIDYRLYFLQFIDIIQKPLDKLTPKDVTAFWGLVNQDDKREPTTKAYIQITIKRFVKWFYHKDLGMRDLIEGLKIKHRLVNEQKINKNTLLTNQEIESLIRSATDIKSKTQIVLLSETAGRPCEIRTAKWKQVNFDNKTISLYSSKTKKSRELPINSAINHLRRWKKENPFKDITDEDYIFPSPRDRTKPIGEFEFGYWIRNLGKKAGISRPIYSYLFRHTQLTNLKRKGVDDLDRKAFAGHSSTSKMQGIYVTMDDRDMQEAIKNKLYAVQELTPEKITELENMVNLQKEFITILMQEKITGKKIKSQQVVDLYNKMGGNAKIV